MKDFSKFEEGLGIYFENKGLLMQAFIHRSYLNEHSDTGLDHNERLEFLGDAVLELIVTEYLYNKYDNPEGDLTSWRAALVNSKMLSELASELNLNDYLYLSRGEAKETNSKARGYILANAFEALVGAIYLDLGYEAAKKFIERAVLSHLDEVLAKKLYKDPKSLFQEEAQERVGVTPGYEVIREWGPDHDKHFVVGVFLEKELVAEGEGPSKQLAQEEAARNGLRVRGWV